MLVCVSLPVFSQQPLYTQLGNDGTLNGIEIYGISEDHENVIWLTTSNGLYSYDGAEFKNYKNENIITNEFFHPYFDENNKFYFTSLAGDIYTLINGKISLFKSASTLPLVRYYSMMCSGSYLYFTSKDSLYQLDSTGKFKTIFGYKNAFLKNIFTPLRERDSLIIYTKNLADKILIKKGNVLIQKSESFEKTLNKTLSERHVFTNYHYSYLKEDLKESQSISYIGPYIHDKAGNIWKGYRNKKGIQIKRKNQAKDQLILNQFYVNYIFEDSENNLWIGTRNNGLLLVSDLEDFSFENETEFNGISNNNNKIYAYSQNRFYEIDPHDITNISHYNDPSKSNIYMFHSKGRLPQNFIQTNNTFRHFNGIKLDKTFKPYTSLIKNHFWLNDSTVVLSTVRGSYLFHPYSQITKGLGSSKYRCLDTKWDPQSNHFLLATTLGLKLISESGILIRDLLYNEKQVSIEYLYNGENGLIGIGPSGKIYHISPSTDSISLLNRIPINFLVNCQLHDAKIYILDKHHVHIYDIAENTLETLPILIPPNVILSGATIFNNNIWISTNKGIIKFNLVEYLNRSYKPKLFVEMFQGHFLHKIKSYKEFKYKNNHVSFKLKSRDYKFQRYNKIYYKLNGADEDYTEISSNETVSYRALSPGNYSFKAQAVTPLGIKSDWIEYNFYIKNPWYQTWWFYLLFVLGVGSIYLLIYLSSIKNSKEKRALKDGLRESQLTAIMAQMNPHFIFNCLNSIQDLILQEDIRASNKYLGKFSDLTRITMQESQKHLITISRELEMIHLYLELEKLRFKDLEYTIDNALSEEQQDLYSMPPMLIQPFIENALKHGLLHSNSEKKLKIEILLSNADLIFRVKDNGIGRKRAEKIKKRQSKFRSFSGGAIAQRVALLNSQKAFQIVILTTDLSKSKSTDWTTSVEIRFKNFNN